MVAEKFAPGPTMDALPVDNAPKRRGRPPGVRNGEGSTAARRGRPSKSLKTEIGATLVMLNMALMVVPPLRDDALDMVEIDKLADAMDQQARNSPTFRKYLTAALAVTSGGQLVSVLGIIMARRFARHEFLLPKEADAMLGSMIGAVKITPKEETLPDNGWVDVVGAANA